MLCTIPFLLTIAKFPFRALFCWLLLAVAFFSFTCLRSISLAHSGALSIGPELTISSKSSVLPISILEELKSMPTIDLVSPSIWLGAYFQERQNSFVARGVDPLSYVEIFELRMNADTRECFFNTKSGAVATSALDPIAGKPPGEILPILSSFLQNKNGSMAWPMHYCGQFAWPDAWEQPPELLFNYRYAADGSALGSPVGTVIALSNGDPTEVAAEIDAHYQHSSAPTSSIPLDEASRLYARQVADMGSVANILILVGFVASLFAIRSLYSQSLKERCEDFFVLHALGYTRRLLVLGVFFELGVILLGGALIGTIVSVLAFPWVGQVLRDFVGVTTLGWRVVLESASIVLISAIALGAGLLPRAFTQPNQQRENA